jgi:hypothetical protein
MWVPEMKILEEDDVLMQMTEAHDRDYTEFNTTSCTQASIFRVVVSGGNRGAYE